MSKKCIMIILDGIGDRSYPELGHRTPLQTARTPALDQLARDGSNGLYHAAFLGQALPSEIAHFVMFGYDMEAFPGRGALEALGADILLGPKDVAILAHFVTVNPSSDTTLVLVDGKPEASEEETRTLVKAIGDYSVNGVRIRFHHTDDFRGILTLTGEVVPFVTDSDPFEHGCLVTEVVPWYKFSNNPDAMRTARTLEAYLDWVYHTLCKHPVNTFRQKAGLQPLNGLVTQRAGRLKKVTPFMESWGLRGLSVASGIVFHGLASYLGMDVKKVADTSSPGNDLAQRLDTALSALTDYDFIHVHTKMPDVAAHKKDPYYKMQVLEELDQGIGSVLERLTGEPDLLVVVAADHSTPSAGPLIHSGEAVPLVFHGRGVRRDLVRQYDEISAAGGAMGFVRGKELMYLVINHLDRVKLQGLMDTPMDHPYWPGHAKPLLLRKPEAGDLK
jgi:2,3-bisphosphoglycerate-independent phosphoglycerate mutase